MPSRDHLAAQPGLAQQLNPNILWGIGTDQGVWRLNTYDLPNAPWRRVAGPAGVTPAQTAVAPDGSVFVVGTDTRTQNVFALANGGNWVPTGFGILASIAPAGARDIWGVTPTGQIQRWQPPAIGFDTVQTNFTASQVATGGDGSVWALDTDDRIYTFNGTSFQIMEGLLRRLTVANAELAWGVAPNNSIWRWDGNTWTSVPQPPDATPAQISITPLGVVYLTDTLNRIYVRTGDTWQTFPGLLSQLSAAPSDRIFFDDPGITTSANSSWSRQTNTNAGAGGYLQTTKTGDSLTLKFSGDSISIHRLTNANGGRARVTVDGREAGTVDFFSQDLTWFVPAILEGFGAGEHTLVMTAVDAGRGTTGNQINIDSYCAPAPQSPTLAQTRALTLVNQRRVLMGMPPAQLSIALNVAAQAHARYLALNFLNHNEIPGRPGFTGVTPSDRAAFFGFRGGVGETINNSAQPDDCLNFWMDTIYHRSPLVDYSSNLLGFGSATVGRDEGCSMSYGQAPGPALTQRLITTWPADNQEGVPLDYTVDAPDPNLADPATLGYVISLRISPAGDNLLGTDTVPFTGTLTDPNGRAIPVFLVTRENAPQPEFMPFSYFVMIPRERLAPNTLYTVQMVGTDARRFRFDRTWRFLSAPNSTVYLDRATSFPRIDNSPTASAEAEFWTAGPVDAPNTSVAYGPTRRFGRMAQPTAHATIPNRFVFRLPEVTRGQPLFYQVTATDAQGKTSRSRVRSIVTVP